MTSRLGGDGVGDGLAVGSGLGVDVGDGAITGVDDVVADGDTITVLEGLVVAEPAPKEDGVSDAPLQAPISVTQTAIASGPRAPRGSADPGFIAITLGGANGQRYGGMAEIAGPNSPIQ